MTTTSLPSADLHTLPAALDPFGADGHHLLAETRSACMEDHRALMSALRELAAIEEAFDTLHRDLVAQGAPERDLQDLADNRAREEAALGIERLHSLSERSEQRWRTVRDLFVLARCYSIDRVLALHAASILGLDRLSPDHKEALERVRTLMRRMRAYVADSPSDAADAEVRAALAELEALRPVSAGAVS